MAEQQAAASALEKENAAGEVTTPPASDRPSSPRPLHHPPPLLSRYAKTSPSGSQTSLDGVAETLAAGGPDGSKNAGKLTPSVSTASFFAAMDAGGDAGDWSYERNEKLARRLFFDLPQEGKDGTLQYLASSCVKLVFDVKWGH